MDYNLKELDPDQSDEQILKEKINSGLQDITKISSIQSQITYEQGNDLDIIENQIIQTSQEINEIKKEYDVALDQTLSYRKKVFAAIMGGISGVAGAFTAIGAYLPAALGTSAGNKTADLMNQNIQDKSK